MKKFWKNTRLKLQLLRIWFIKNLAMFLEIAGIILVILMLTGVIPEDAPVLGAIFGDLLEAIHKILETNDVNQGWVSFISAALSIISAVGMFTLKARSISINDIKSDKLKLTLVQAGLYFNSDGRLVRKVEKATQTDINGDGKIDNEEIESPKLGGPISKTIEAIREFGIIVGTDFAENDSVETDNYKQALDKANLTKAAEGQKELKDNLLSDGVLAISEIGSNIASSEMTNAPLNSENEKEALLKVSFWKKIALWFKGLPEKWEKSKAERAAKKEKRRKIREERAKARRLAKEQKLAAKASKKEVSAATTSTIKKFKKAEIINNNMEKDSLIKDIKEKSTKQTASTVSVSAVATQPKKRARAGSLSNLY